MRKNLTLICLIFFSISLVLIIGIVSAYIFPSTNQLNKDKLVPGREGQLAPYVELAQAKVGSVDLKFVGGYAGGAYFEYRVDGEVKTSGTAHPITGDWIYPGVWVVANNVIDKNILANDKVEVRLALGGERDWDFDWTTFYVLPNPDLDGDGILNEEDRCSNTIADDLFVGPGINRHVWNGNSFVILVPGKKGTFNEIPSEFSITNTHGCSCTQILDALTNEFSTDMVGHYKFGCSKGIVEDWIARE